MSQSALAEAVGVQRTSVSNWERGVHEPTARNLEDIGRALRLSPDALRSMGASLVAGVRESSDRGYTVRASIRVPPRAYQQIFEYCELLEAAGVPEEQVDEARRLMSGETFNTLRKHMLDERTEDGWLKDVRAAWAFIRDTLKVQGFDL